MFELNNERTKVPIKIWLPKIEEVEESCLEQAYHLAELPFAYSHVCLMPDTHTGMGMPIGGVLATKEVIIPNAVGVDIGCGMNYCSTNIKVNAIRDIMTGNGTLLQSIVGAVMRAIPVGFRGYKEKQECTTLDQAKEQMQVYQKDSELLPFFEEAYHKVGTLGGGNHFIELQEDEEGMLAIMIHSGSRHLGKEVCDYFHKKATQLNRQWDSPVPEEYRLSYLPVDDPVGVQYLHWMELCLSFAYENREHMMNKVCQIVSEQLKKYAGLEVEYSDQINCHHNYASKEIHGGEDVWVHRKGATRARKDELAVIPGAMGSYSFVVRGLGNEESFCTSSHGAGRAYSRKGAMNTFSVEEVVLDLREQGVILGKNKKSDLPEECRMAYKDIDEVMENQQDLVVPIKRLKTVAVVKG